METENVDGNKSLCSIRGEKYLDQLTDRHHLKESVTLYKHNKVL